MTRSPRAASYIWPVLTTPIRREEFLIAKALAAFVPDSRHRVRGLWDLSRRGGAVRPSGDRSAIYAGQHVLVQLLFTPLLAGWAIWAGIAVATGSADVRVAQQLSALVVAPGHG